MNTTFPCPNPACTHAFAPSAVRGASRLVCPRCGTVFQFGAAAAPASRPPAATKPPAAPPRPAAPPAKPPAPKAVAPAPPARLVPPAAAPPVAQPVAPVAVPVFAPPPSELQFNSKPELLVSPPKTGGERRKRRLGPLLAILGVVVLGLGVGVWLTLWLVHFKKAGRAEDDPVRAASLFNARFDWPERPWQRDTNIEFKLHVNLGMRVAQQNNCMGLYFKDYKTRLPGEAELVDEALGKLREYFRGLEWELKRDEKIELAGRPALLMEFQGEDPEHVPMNGECCMMAHRGYAYWFFTWGPLEDREMVRPHWEGLRERLHLLDGRKGWAESPRESDEVRGTRANYQIRYAKELWSHKVPAEYDPMADVVLRGDEPDPDRRRLASKTATFRVLVLPKQENLAAAAAAARDYLQKREEADYPGTTVQPIRDKGGAAVDGEAEVGRLRGHLSKLRVQNTEDLERFVVLAVVNRPEGVVALVGDCLWERRDIWVPEFAALIRSFKAR